MRASTIVVFAPSYLLGSTLQKTSIQQRSFIVILFATTAARISGLSITRIALIASSPIIRTIVIPFATTRFSISVGATTVITLGVLSSITLAIIAIITTASTTLSATATTACCTADTTKVE